MNGRRALGIAPRALAAMLIVVTSTDALSQNGARPPPRADTTLRASDQYGAGGLHRVMLGADYRDLWAAPIAVPFLDLTTFAGGELPLPEPGTLRRPQTDPGRWCQAQRVHRCQWPVWDRSGGTCHCKSP